MYPGVLILEFTHSEVLAPSRRSTLKGINTPMGTSAVLQRDRGQAAAPTGGFCNDWVNSCDSVANNCCQSRLKALLQELVCADVLVGVQTAFA